MYPAIESMPVTPAPKANTKPSQMSYVREKLRTYVRENNNAKDKRLLECHAHCFIALS